MWPGKNIKIKISDWKKLEDELNQENKLKGNLMVLGTEKEVHISELLVFKS